MKIKQSFLISVLTVGLVGVLSGSALANTIFAPERGETIFVVGQDLENINAYTDEFKTPGGFMFYTSIQVLDGLYEPAEDRGAGIQHANAVIEKYPNTVVQLGLYMVGALEDTVRGVYDANLDKLAGWIKETKRPVYLRIGYEFDLPDNGYEPKAYIAAFQYVVDYLREKGVTNANYVWHSYGYVNPGLLPTMWYPGADYVDWVGVSFFNAFNKWNINYLMRFAASQQRPFMLAEATPYRIGIKDGKESWKRWFKHLFAFIEENEVRMDSYISADWNKLSMFRGDDWGDSRVQENREVKRRWKKELRKDRYLLSSEKLFEKINYE